MSPARGFLVELPLKLTVQPYFLPTMPISWIVLSTQLKGQPDTPIFTFAGDWRGSGVECCLVPLSEILKEVQVWKFLDPAAVFEPVFLKGIQCTGSYEQVKIIFQKINEEVISI